MASGIGRGLVRTTLSDWIAGSNLQLIMVKLIADQVDRWFFDWIAVSCQINLSKTGQDCSETGLRIIIFSSIQMFFCCFVLYIWLLLKFKTEG